MNLNRIITSFYIILFAGLGLTAGFLFFEAHGEYNRLKQIESASKQMLADKKALLGEQEKTLERLRTDPAFVEKVIRRRLGYSKPDEMIFRFQD